ncbi:hypothetical protein [Candidatus Binatus sp.]|uniref:hypothetical protein n=1 Tax=Candidatus Binatus sp. TaxID=2811406 RepID=UPI003BB025B2
MPSNRNTNPQNPIDQSDRVYSIEAVLMDPRRRIHFPARLTRGLDWFEKASEYLAILKLEEVGRISLLPWRETAAAIVAKRKELLDKMPDSEVEKALLILEDRYRELRVDTESRPTIPESAAVHLCGSGGFDKYVYVVRRALRLELWSASYRNEQILSESALLDGLP